MFAGSSVALMFASRTTFDPAARISLLQLQPRHFGAAIIAISCLADAFHGNPYMQSIPRSCTVCSTTMVLFDRQPVDEKHEVLFFECPLCGASSQTVTYSTTAPVTASYRNRVAQGNETTRE